MEPTPAQPYNGGYPSNPTPAYVGSSPEASSSATDSQFSTTAAHATGTGKYPTDASSYGQQSNTSGLQDTLNNALASGKKWLSDSGLGDKAQQLPQAAKDLSNKALTSINGLTTTQKAVGVGLLAAGVAFLATRGGKNKQDDGEYRHKARRSPFDHQPHTKDGDYAGRGQRPWGGSRYGTASAQASAGRSRVSSGSGYSSSPSSAHSNDFGGQQPSSRGTSQHGSSAQAGSGQRRDQGPASGSRYDASTSGSQNPNNLDELNSAF